MSEQQEVSIGAQQYVPNDQSADGRFILDPALTNCVREVGQKLAVNRGLVRQKLGKAAGTQSDLECSNALLPTAAAHFVLGNLAQGTNNPGKAIEHYRPAAGSDSDVGQRAASALVRLDLPRNPGS